MGCGRMKALSHKTFPNFMHHRKCKTGNTRLKYRPIILGSVCAYYVPDKALQAHRPIVRTQETRSDPHELGPKLLVDP